MNVSKNVQEAYELLQQRPLSDQHAQGYSFLHKKSGARVVIMENDDENKVFYIAFRTPPLDSMGTPHIIEHSVLCGSEKFPVKDPFIELVKGSFHIFYYAMTFPVKTFYPVASCNDKDYQNLLDVYMDAVLHPNIYREENIFKQEGWHYELEDETQDLFINGVVYNEMKGAFSSGDSVVERSIQRSLYPDTPYFHESGGDPKDIPKLTYERFLDFHKTYYHPSNAYIYLYGNMDFEEKLRWLDETYLSAYDRLLLDSTIPVQAPFDAPACEELSYSISSAESEEDNTYLVYNWSVGTNLNPEHYIAFEILDYALLSSNGAPLKQALLDEGIGHDIYGGYDNGILQPFFSVVAKNANEEDKARFLEIIEKELRTQAQGLNKTTLLAAINGAEFKAREADFGRYPKGLMFGLQMLDSWLYDDGAPFLHMDPLAVYAALREKIETNYFEELIETYLLKNNHASFLCVTPKKGLTAENDRALAAACRAYQDGLSDEEIQALVAQTKALAAYQEEPSAKEDLETIPMLSRADMKREADPYSNVEEVREGITFLRHDYDTNGILYVDYLFDLAHISRELLPYVGILQLFLGRLNTDDYAFVDLANEIHLHTGGMYTETNIVGVYTGEKEYEVKLELRIRTLESNLQKAIALAMSILCKTQFLDDKRMFEVLAQTRSRLQTEISESGHTMAANRVLSYTSRRALVNDMLHGIRLYRLLEQLVNHYEEEKEHLKETLSALCEKILQSTKLLVSVTGSAEGFAKVQEETQKLVQSFGKAKAYAPAEIALPTVTDEGFLDASQIQYVALAGSFAEAGLPYTGALRVFRCMMNYEYLWQNIRVRGGAYGCSCNVLRSGEVYFTSYRDPNLSRTLEVYQGVADFLANFDADERDMTRYCIGTFSEMDTPLTPAGAGRRSLLAYLSGMTQELLQQDRDQVLATDAATMRALAGHLQSVLENAHICAIGNEEKLLQEAELFHHTEVL